MILWVRDRFKNLSFYHYRMIIVTIFVPVILTVVVTYLPVTPRVPQKLQGPVHGDPWWG